MIKAPANYKTLEIAVVVKIAKTFISSDPRMPADFPPDELRKVITINWSMQTNCYKGMVPAPLLDWILTHPPIAITFEGAEFHLLAAPAEVDTAGTGAQVQTNYKFKAFIKAMTPEFPNTPEALELTRATLLASFAKAYLKVVSVRRPTDSEGMNTPLNFYFFDCVPDPACPGHPAEHLSAVLPVITERNHEIRIGVTKAFMQFEGAGICSTCLKYRCEGHSSRSTDTSQRDGLARNLDKKRNRSRYDEMP